jgi:putative aldouronate transport system substrate-binding protein
MRKLALLLLALILVLSTTSTILAEKAEAKKYTAMVSVGADQGSFSDMWLFEVIEEKFNVTFDFIEVSSEGYNEKLSLAFATNDLPDVLFSMSSTDISYYAAQKMIQPLDEYMTEEHLPNLLYWFERYPAYKRALYYPDGHVYSIQGLIGLERELSQARSWINKDWLDQLKMDYPKTLDDFYAFLSAVKTTDLNGNGINDEIPFAGISNGFDSYRDNTIPVLTALGMTSKTFEAYDGVVKFNPTTDAYKDFLAYMHMLWSEGLIDNEYFTQTNEQLNAKISSGLCGSMTDYAHWLRIGDDSWKAYTAYDPMISDRNNVQRWPASDTTVGRNFIVTSACEDVAGLMPVLNWALTPDAIYDPVKGDNMAGATVNVLGKPINSWDKYYEYGWEIITKTDEETGEEYQVISSRYPENEFNSLNAFRNAVLTPNVFPVCEVFEGNPVHYSHYGNEKEISLAVEIVKHNAPFYHTGWSNNIRYTADEAEEIALLQNDIYTYCEQMIAQFITGDVSLDEFDTFVAGCNARGLERFIEINQIAYDRYYSVN